MAAAGLTTMTLLVPAIEPLTVSLPVIVWLPAVLRVALKVPIPFVSVESAGCRVEAERR